MWSWLRLRKLKPAAAVASAARRVVAVGTPERSAAVGTENCRLGAEPQSAHPLLSLLPPGSIEHLLETGALEEYAKGTTIYRAGEPCDAIFLIVSGRCEARRPGNGHVGRVEDVFGPGDVLGARSLLSQEAHACTVVVVTRAVLLRIPATELDTLFASDPCLVGRFSHALITRDATTRERSPRVRRVVTLLPLAQRVNADAVLHRLARSIRDITHQRVLVIDLCVDHGDEEGRCLLGEMNFGTEFAFARQLRLADGFDKVHLAVHTESREAAAIAPLLSHCGWHYDYVILQLAPDTPLAIVTESLIQSDLGFILIQPSSRNLYDFQLLTRELDARSSWASSHVRPLLFAEESLAAPEVHNTLRHLGHPAHSIIRGFPLRDDGSLGDRRFDLAIHRLAREIARCRIGLALSSGGAKGLAHIGVIQVLEENGIEIDCIAGASMGAYIGATWAYGFDGTKLEMLAREHEGRWGLLHFFDPVIPPRQGFIRTRRTVQRLRNSLGDVHFSELVRPLRVVATHLDTLERVVFSSGDVVNAVNASIAIPGVCVPVTLDGETYIDGGIADPLPVDVLEEMGIERIIAVNVIPTPERVRYWMDAAREPNGREKPRTGIKRFLHSHLDYAASGNVIDTMMRAINGAQTRVAEAAAREADLVLRPVSNDSAWHDFTHPRKYITLGRSVAEEQIREIKALAGGTNHEPPQPMAIASDLAA